MDVAMPPIQRVAAMHDPFAWSFPLVRLFGINVRIHWLFPFVALGCVLHAAFSPRLPPLEGRWVDALILIIILYFAVLLHEFGHAFMARWVDGDCQEILLWPLGGLAAVDIPYRPRAHFLVAAAGPAVNLLICLVCVLLLLLTEQAFQPPWNPLPNGYPVRDHLGQVTLVTWGGTSVQLGVYSLPVWLARTFWVSWFLALLNTILAGFPLDGGRMLQALLWPSLGYRQSMLTAIFTGFVVVFLVGLYAIVLDSVLTMGLALFVFVSCQRQWVLLETGGDEGIFGYDFSQGYTSLERKQEREGPTSAPPVRKLSWWQRWRQRRAAQRLQKEIEQRESDARRLDELLEKIYKEGEGALTDEERRFMKRVSDRFRNRP